jgi:ATP-binding cassette, subfamily B, bacterial MsbA
MGNRQVIRGLLRFTRDYRWALPGLVVLGMLASLAEGLGIGLLIPMLDHLLDDGAAPAGPFAHLMQQIGGWIEGDSRLAVLGALIILLIVVKSLILFADVGLATWLNGRVTHDLRVALCRRMLGMDYGDFSRADQGRLVSVIESQTHRTSEALTVLSTLIGAACTVVIFTLLLLLISWPLTVTVVLGVLLVSLVMRRLTARANRHGETFVDAYGVLTGRIVEGLAQMRTIRLFGQERWEEGRLARDSDAVRQAFVRTNLTAGMIPPLAELLYLPLFLAVLLVAWQLDIGLSSLFAFLVLLYRMQPRLKDLDHARVTLGTYGGAIRQIAEQLAPEAAPRPASGTRPFCGLAQEIVLDRVTFSYGRAGAALPAVSEVSLRIGKGEVVALVGGSGAGKSTLVNLLCRLYDPQEGQIRVDGVPLAELDLASWRARIGFAGQDAELMSDTVAENIAYGRPGADTAAIERAARQAHADQFIAALPEGYGTRLGPRGLSLSGGQRQRIALARALVREPDLLILDEATNALDGLSEQAIQETIEELRGRLTIVLIAHRLSTVRLADRVVAMMDGRVIEQGRPQELLRRDGLYARLHALQVADA